MSFTLALIVAISKNNVIGVDGKLPWHIPEDLLHFRDTTIGYPVIMGRKTYESINKPLYGRTNIIISRDVSLNIPGCYITGSLNEAINYAKNLSVKAFVIGGASIYKEAISIADEMYITEVDGDFIGDTFFPSYEDRDWECTETHKYIPTRGYCFFKYERTNEELKNVI